MHMYGCTCMCNVHVRAFVHAHMFVSVCARACESQEEPCLAARSRVSMHSQAACRRRRSRSSGSPTGSPLRRTCRRPGPPWSCSSSGRASHTRARHRAARSPIPSATRPCFVAWIQNPSCARSVARACNPGAFLPHKRATDAAAACMQMRILSALLTEQHVLLCSNDLWLLSMVANALVGLLAPVFDWKHVFIAVVRAARVHVWMHVWMRVFVCHHPPCASTPRAPACACSFRAGCSARHRRQYRRSWVYTRASWSRRTSASRCPPHSS
jgi:hypothetical protein